MSSNPKTLLTEEEYLALERQAEFKSEFYDGEMFAMAGASRTHNRIVTNVVTLLDNQLRQRPCNVYANDLRVKIPATGLYTYPDLVVTCGEEKFVDDKQDVLLNPLAIIEVLSDSTEAYDRGRKFEQYRSIVSFQVYVLIAQDASRAEKYVKQEDGKFWLYSEVHGVDEIVTVEAIDCVMKIEDIYDKVRSL
ncbi:MAG: Uma2 family endonuclease [Pyrinomonadaceae bacterium]